MRCFGVYFCTAPSVSSCFAALRLPRAFSRSHVRLLVLLRAAAPSTCVFPLPRPSTGPASRRCAFHVRFPAPTSIYRSGFASFCLPSALYLSHVRIPVLCRVIAPSICVLPLPRPCTLRNIHLRSTSPTSVHWRWFPPLCLESALFDSDVCIPVLFFAVASCICVLAVFRLYAGPVSRHGALKLPFLSLRSV